MHTTANKKPTLLLFGFALCLLMPNFASAKSIAPNKYIKKPIVVQPTSAPKQKKDLSQADVSNLIKKHIEDLLRSGRVVTNTQAVELSLEKIEHLNRSLNQDAPGPQHYYAPAAAIAGVGTFVSASNVSAENVNSTNSTIAAASVVSLTVSDLSTLQGGLYLTTPAAGNLIDSDTGAFLSSGGTWTNASSKNLKENFTTLDSDAILQNILGLSITRWNYKKESASTTHIGPLAEDFYAAFDVGGENGGKAISTIDPSGVALAGIQALYKKIEGLHERVRALEMSANQCRVPTEETRVHIEPPLTETTLNETSLPKNDTTTEQTSVVPDTKNSPDAPSIETTSTPPTI